MPPMQPGPAAPPPTLSGVGAQATAGKGAPPAGGAPAPTPQGGGGQGQLTPEQIKNFAAAMTPENAQVLTMVVGAVLKDSLAMLSQAAQGGQQAPPGGAPPQGGQVPAGPAPTPQPAPGGGLMSPTA